MAIHILITTLGTRLLEVAFQIRSQSTLDVSNRDRRSMFACLEPLVLLSRSRVAILVRRYTIYRPA
jgi:hypothetical protein